MARRAGSTTGTYVLGVIVLAVVLGIFALAFTANRGLPFDQTTQVKAAFTNTDSLQTGDEVRRFSDRVGSVASIEYRDGLAIVTMELDGEPELYADASAAIWDFSALAQKFVELDYGTPEAGPLGDEPIATERTVDSSDLYELLNVFDPATRDAAASAVRALGGGAAGHGPDLHALVETAPDLLPDLGTVSAALASDQANLPAFLQNIDQVSSRFVGRRGDIEALIRGFGTTLDAIAVDDAQPLSATLQKLPSTLQNAETAFDALNAPLASTEAAFAALEPGFEGLGEATPDLRGFFRESQDPLDKVPGVSEDAEPAVEDLTETAADLRPLAPRVAEFFDDLQEPIDVLAPYSKETGYLFVRLHSFVSQSVAPGIHYARAQVTVGPASVTNSVVRDEFTLPHNRYPDPGEASLDRATLPGGMTLPGPGGN